MNLELMVSARKSRHTHKTMWKNTHNTATNNREKASK